MTRTMAWACVFAAILIIVGYGTVSILKDREEAPARYQEGVSSLKRIGAIQLGDDTTLHLWAFDFEDKRCLWVKSSARPDGQGKLTCWEKKP